MGAAVAVPGVLGALGLLQQSKANKKQSQAIDAQNASTADQQEIARFYMDRVKNANPYEQQIINYFMNRAGFGNGGVGAGMGNGQPLSSGMGQRSDLNQGDPFPLYGSRSTLPGLNITTPKGSPVGTPGAPPGSVAGSLGIYDDPEYRLLRQKAGEDIGRFAQKQRREFAGSIMDRGIGASSVAAGGNARITSDAERGYADFIRQLAIGARDKQDQLAQQAFNSLAPSLAGAGQASAIFGNLGSQAGQNAALYGQQAGAAGGALGNALQAYMQQQQLKQYLNRTPTPPVVVNPGGGNGPTSALGNVVVPQGEWF